MNRRDFTLFPTLLALGFSLHGPSRAQTQPITPTSSAKLVALRTWPAKEYVRVTLEFDGKLSQTSFLTDQGPPRFVLDLEGLPWSTDTQARLTSLVAENPFVERVRAAQHGTGLRLVLDLKKPVLAQVSMVAPLGAYKSRLLIDLYPQTADLIGLWLAQQQGVGGEATASNPSNPIQNGVATPRESDFSKPKPPVLADNTGAKPIAKPPNASTAKRPKIIAIDAGHGGEDPGAIGPAGTKEKDVVLAMALQLAERMRKTYGWQAVLTRDGDYFVPLAQRVQKARAAKADVFVSLHADAFINPAARGASVFALSQKGASSAAAKWMANKENEADLVGGLNLSDKDKLLSSVMLDMSTTAQIKSSLKLGAGLLKQLDSVAHLHKKHVEQAGFAVLKAPDIPSVLIETAFISHPDEEQLLADPAHQTMLVRAMAKALASAIV